MTKSTLHYFSYGTNRDLDMMAAIIGRKNIVGEPGKLIGYELCIQKVEHIPGVSLATAPTELSPREIVTKVFDENFELYIIKPNANAETYGTIWQLNPEEYELVREWELLEFGMQEDIRAMALDSKGSVVNIVTHGSLSTSTPIDRCVAGDTYEDYIVPKKDILQVAERVRSEYIERTKNKEKTKSDSF